MSSDQAVDPRGSEMPRSSSFDIVFVDGEFVSTDQGRLSVHANAVSYGTGTFEGMRAVWNDEADELYVLEPGAHYDRMRRSANALGLTLPHTTAELVEITLELLRRNDARTDLRSVLALKQAESVRSGWRSEPGKPAWRLVLVRWGALRGDGPLPLGESLPLFSLPEALGCIRRYAGTCSARRLPPACR